MDEITIEFGDLRRISLPYQTQQVSPPFGLAVTPVVGGGTFAAATYFWEVTATTALGETTVSNEATTAVVLNGSANLTWNLPLGPITHVKVYRGTATGAENVLVTTLPGNATAFTDTNVGGAATPPVANTATLADTQLITGYGEFLGFSLSETTGTAAADIRIQDTALDLADFRIPAGGSLTAGPATRGVPLNGGINVHVNSGSVRGVVWVGIDC